MDSEIKKAIIMEHYSNPHNREEIHDDNYIKVNSKSETCIDNLDIYLKMNGDVIEDLKFYGEACAISTSAASIMTELLKGKTITEANNIISNYDNMVLEKDYDKDCLGDALCYDEIFNQTNRINCALIPWRGIKKALDQYEEKK